MCCIKIHLQKVYLIVPSKRKYAKKKGSFQFEDLKRRLILPVKIWDFKTLQKAQKGSYPMRRRRRLLFLFSYGMPKGAYKGRRLRQEYAELPSA